MIAAVDENQIETSKRILKKKNIIAMTCYATQWWSEVKDLFVEIISLFSYLLKLTPLFYD